MRSGVALDQGLAFSRLLSIHCCGYDYDYDYLQAKLLQTLFGSRHVERPKDALIWGKKRDLTIESSKWTAV